MNVLNKLAKTECKLKEIFTNQLGKMSNINGIFVK